MTCTRAKRTTNPFESSWIRKEKLVTINADICNPMMRTSCGGDRNFLAMTTVEGNYVIVHFLKSGSGIKLCYKNYINWMDRHSGKRVGRIQTENAAGITQTEKESGRIGIVLTTSLHYSPQSNGPAERVNRILVEKTPAILDHPGLKLNHRCEAAQHVTDLLNWTATPELGFTIPMEALLGTVFSNFRLRAFGCAVFVHKPQETRHDTFECRTEKCINLGNEHGLHRVYLNESRRTTTTKHISFDERQFFFLRRLMKYPRVVEQHGEPAEE